MAWDSTYTNLGAWGTTYERWISTLWDALESVGWTIVRSGDGLASFSAVGSVFVAVPRYAPGAGGMANRWAWAVLRSPNGVTEVLFQRDPAGSGWGYNWLPAWSQAAGFVGGAPATRATAVDEHGFDTALPTVAALFQGIDCYVNCIVSDAAIEGEYPWFFWVLDTAAGSVRGHAYMDVAGQRAAADASPIITGRYAGNLDKGSLDTGARSRAFYDYGGGGEAFEAASGASRFWGAGGVGQLPFISDPDPAGVYHSAPVEWWFSISATAWKGRGQLVSLPEKDDHNTIYEAQDGTVYVGLYGGANPALLVPGWPDTTTCPLPDLGGGVVVKDLVVHGGDTQDVTPPTLAVVSPVVGSIITPPTPFVIDITDDVGLGLVVLTTEMGQVHEVVWLRDSFAPLYAAGSSRVAIAGGYRYTVRRAGGWTSSPTFRVEAIDTAGNLGA